MIDDPPRQVVELPDRKEISLCEAVTAVVRGEALNVRQYQSREAPPESESLADFFDLQASSTEGLIALRGQAPGASNFAA